MRYHRRRGWEIRASETTPESIFLDRRAFVAGAGALAAYAGLARRPAPMNPIRPPRFIRPSATRLTRSIAT